MRDSFSNILCSKCRYFYPDILLETMQNLLKTILFALIALVFIGCHTTRCFAEEMMGFQLIPCFLYELQ